MKQHFFNFTGYKALNKMIWKDMEGSGHEMSLRYYPSICLQELKRIIKTLCQDTWPLGKESNLKTSKNQGRHANHPT
jgi:hypothetical protein